MNYHKQKIKTTIIVILALILIPTINAMPDAEINRVTNQIAQQIENQEPTFTEILTTVYHTSLSTDFPKWTTGEDDNYDVTTSIYWCIIPESKRGFYEDIMCQGSGIHEKKVYSYKGINQNPQDSIPLDGSYQRGITSKGLDPKPKWTVAINPDKTTQCHIPYGTVMYIDFGPENPWTGLYRAEDTGSAFRGECKMDIYTGIGEQSSKDAEQYVSLKTPDIYILEPDSPSKPPTLSRTELAQNYKFITKEEYANEHGAHIFGSQYVPGLNPNLNEVGELILPYSFKMIISGLSNFYENIQEFSNQALRECNNKNYEQKAACAYNIAKQYEDKNTIINHCSQSPMPINKENIQQGQNITIGGIIKQKTETNNYLEITLKQIIGESINIQIPWGIETIRISDTQKNFLILKDVKVTNKTNEYIEIEITESEQVKFLEDTDDDWIKKENTYNTVLKTTDCQKDTNCLCEVDIIETTKEYVQRYTDLASLGQENIRTNIQIRQKTNQLLFGKGTTQNLVFLQQKPQDVRTCMPQKKHVIFCAEQEEKPNKLYSNFYPKMNFTLLI